MSDPGETDCYGPVARGVHWLVAGLAVVVVALGLAIPGAPRETFTRDVLMLLHRSIGLSILVLMLFRIAWRLGHPAPPLPADFSRLETLTAHTDHVLMYILFLLMPLSGYINAAASGHAVSFFGLFMIPPVLPENERLSQAAMALHLSIQLLLYACVAVHVAGALMHRILARHRILERMLPLRRAAAGDGTP